METRPDAPACAGRRGRPILRPLVPHLHVAVSRPLTPVLLGFLLVGCATSGPFASPPYDDYGDPHDAYERPATATHAARPAAPEEHALARRLDAEVNRWLGTPHVLGGTGRDGVDCSAFVQNVFADALAVALPRTTEDQVHAGEAVRPDALRTGDLVFFRPDKGTRHVGIFLGDGLFAHASSSQGVTRSRLAEPYWQAAYWTARRVLPSEARAMVHPAEVHAPGVRITPRRLPDPPEAPPRRRGW